MSLKRIRILHVLSDTNIGGAGRLLYNLARSIDESRLEFIYAFPEGSQLIGLFKQQDPESKIYTFTHGKDRSFDLAAIKELIKMIKTVSPDILHAHSSFFARVAARLSGIDKPRIVYTKHCVFDSPRIVKSKLFKKAYATIDQMFCGRIVAVADCAKEKLAEYGIDPDRVTVIINGVEPLEKISEPEKLKIREELNIHPDAFVVGISARLEECKGHATLLRAAWLTKKNKVDNVVFLIVGGGSCERSLNELSSELEISDRVIFTGFQNNVARNVNIFDVNVNCSTGTETSSLAISEGLSLGKPIIASDFGGNPNMVKEGVSGFLFPKRDFMALYDKIMLIKNDKSLLKRLSENAEKDFSERFSALLMASQYEKFYAEIMINNTKKRLCDS